MRKVIARRLTESKQQVPHFYLTVDCEIDTLLKARADINAKAPEKGAGAYKLSVNDFVIKAAALALKRVPGGQRVVERRRHAAVRARSTSRSRSRSPAA